MPLRNLLRQSITARRISKRVRRLDPSKDEWFEDHYPQWRAKRVAAIRDHFGADFFSGKMLLEVGCGFGAIGAEFAALGACVTCSDGRPGHIAEVRQRRPEVAETVVADLDKPWAFSTRFDVLIHMGVLYHLGNPEQAIRDALGAADHIVLETEVIDSADTSAQAEITEVGYDQAVNYQGIRPSGAMIEQLISEAGRPFTRIADDRCNDGVHVYDWLVMDTGRYTPGQRRLWFIGPS